MHKIYTFLFCLLTGILFSQSISIIPKPNQVSWLPGNFTTPDTFFLFYDNAFKKEASFLENFLIESGAAIEGIENPEQAHIILETDTNLAGKEAYELEIQPTTIRIKAGQSSGLFYGVQSLLQIMRFEKKIPCLSIQDEPRFPYRGMHLDVCRHFFPVSFIKEYIDLLATYKFNTFHWHLTEDQGWRIEIKQYPKLQEIAAYRPETLIGHYNDQPQKFDGQRYGGYYTQEEVKEIVQYAADRQITVIPEIEMPGHALAALSAYPELSCTGGPHTAATKWGVFDDVFCTKEATFSFLENVLDEVMTLFPSTYIHIGGDECPKTRWKTCETCQGKIKELGLKDEHDLQSWFIQRIEKYLNQHGRQIIGWDEILEGGLAPNATVMSWRGTQGGIEAAQSGHGVIMTPTSHCYLDYYQSDDPNEPLAIGGFLPLQKVYGFDPVPKELDEKEAAYILGTQGNVWTEYMATTHQVEYMVLPRMQAMAEIGWTQLQHKDFSNFIKRLDAHFTWWDDLDLNYADKTLEIKSDFHLIPGGIGITLQALHPEASIFYTIGDQEKLIKYLPGDTIRLSGNEKIIARAQKDGRKPGKRKIINIDYHKGMGHEVELVSQPANVYAGYGVASLFNGINGSNEKYGDNEWLGFSGKNVEAILHFDRPKKISSLSTRFFHGPGQWIYAPESVEIYVLSESGAYGLLTKKEVETLSQKVIPFELNFDEIETQSLKIIVNRFGIIPEGGAGAGHEAWLFIDELRLN